MDRCRDCEEAMGIHSSATKPDDRCDYHQGCKDGYETGYQDGYHNGQVDADCEPHIG